MSDHILSPYLITGSEHNGDALPKNYKGFSSIPKSATEITKIVTAYISRHTSRKKSKYVYKTWHRMAKTWM